MRRVPWPLVTAAALLVLLAVLAPLQYRWIGDVSEAERDRMRASLRARATELAQEFDGELTRIYAAFHVDGDRLDVDPPAALTDAYARWQSNTLQSDIVSAVYLADAGTDAASPPLRFDPVRQTLEASEWPAAVRAALTHGHASVPTIGGFPPPVLLLGVMNASIPAVIVTVPHVKRTVSSGMTTVVADPTALARAIVVVLDGARLVHGLLEPLVAKHFGDAARSEYVVTIVRRDDPTSPVFSSTPAPIDAQSADVTAGLFDLHMDELDRFAGDPAGLLPRSRTGERQMSFTIVRRGSADGRRILVDRGAQGGQWQLRARHRSGSLETLVAASRRRNLAISLGVLGLLAASFVLVIVSAQRQQRLARQQMEFVAAVSHELRTPLAVICSAGENLADGVVADATQVRRYGSLVETEGRRLAAMVERVLDFAGIASGPPPRARAEVDLADVVHQAVSGVEADARDREVTINVHTNGARLRVVGDAEALRSAVGNVIGNAVKYSPRGSSVDVACDADLTNVRVRVTDRGLGIDAHDLPHIFKPFYRGRRALDAEVRGSGVGLSVVSHVVNAHRGRIHVDSRPAQGTTVVVELPAAT